MKTMKPLAPLLLLILSSLLTTTNACHEDEREILLSFKSHILDPSNQLSSWQGQNCCIWYGIRCSDSLHVTTLDLRNPNPESLIVNRNSKLLPTSDTNSTAIIGTVPPSLFSLSHINYIDLSFNNFNFSNIPTGLANLTALSYLNLSNAMFSGSITTQLSNLTALRMLDLSCSFPAVDFSTMYIDLSSSITYYSGDSFTHISRGGLRFPNLDWMKKLRNLRVLVLTGVDLSKALLSPIANLLNLRELELSNCEIPGRIPIEHLLNLTHLSTLEMNLNFFRTQIPPELTNMTSLSIIRLTESSLQGSVPYLPRLKRILLGNNPDLTVNMHSMFSVPWPQLEVIDISSAQVIGTIPPSIGNMTSLREFQASNCFIHGQLPASMMNLSRLEILMLQTNNLYGQLSPSISNLKSLQYLSLLQNSFNGSIPDTICRISSLLYIALSSNSFSGTLPDCIGQLPNLRYLFLGRNTMSGTIPSLASFLQNSNLIMLDLGFSGLTVNIDKHQISTNFQPQLLTLDSCKLGGQVPAFLSNMTQLSALSLSYNSLAGEIPSWLWNLPNLGYVNLRLNNIHGTLPPEIKLKSYFGPTGLLVGGNQLRGTIPSLMENVDVLDMSRNNFTGEIPIQLGLQNIKYLTLSGNNFFGRIPSSFCDESNQLMLLDLSNNSLRGTVPTSLGNCKSLMFLSLRRNNLSGQLPNQLDGTSNLKYLDVSDNNFIGTFPAFIHKQQQLIVLNMGRNKFEGGIPRYIGDLKDLRILVLKFNSFNGSIPQEICMLENLQIISFSSNQLSGPIPERLSGLKMLLSRPVDGDVLGFVISDVYAGVEVEMVAKGFLHHLEEVRTYHSGIDISHNNLSGSLSSELGMLQGLYMLNLSHNSISSNIPSSIGNMRKLESLDLSFNNLNGEIPATLTALDSLTILSLSNNNLSGKIPSGPHFDTLSRDGFAFMGNKYLCGATGAVITCDRNNSESLTPDSNKEASGEKKLLYSFVFLGFGVGTSGFFLTLHLMNETWKQRYWAFIDRIASRIISCFKLFKNFSIN